MVNEPQSETNARVIHSVGLDLLGFLPDFPVYSDDHDLTNQTVKVNKDMKEFVH